MNVPGKWKHVTRHGKWEPTRNERASGSWVMSDDGIWHKKKKVE